MTATTAQITQAASILGNNPGGGSLGGYARGAGAIAIDRVIDEIVNTDQLAGGMLPEPFNTWILHALRSFHEVMTSLTGDSSAIGAHIGQLVKTAATVKYQATFVADTRSRARDCWEGPGAQAFDTRAQAAGLATDAVAGVLVFSAGRHLELAGQQASAKRGVIQLVCNLAAELVRMAIRFLAQMGVSLAMGGWDVVSNTVSGAASGAWNGMRDGWSRGGFAGAVGGFFSGMFGGGADGARRGIEEAKARIRAAFNNFVNWALGRVGQILREVHAFVKRYVENMVAVVGEISGAGVRSTRAAALLRGQNDPRTHSERPRDGTYGETLAGSGPRAMDGPLIDLNQAIDPNKPVPAGYSRATDADLAALGLTRADLTDANGFMAEVFVDKDGGYVIAFAGTGAVDHKPVPDAVEDAVGGGTMSPQTGNVLRLTEKIQNSGHGDDVVYTGHSLGGRLAAIASLDTGNAAVTYDAAGVSDATVRYIANKNGVDPETLVNQANNGQVRRYYAGDDPLTAVQERWGRGYADSLPDAIGKPIPIGPFNNNQPTSIDSILGYGKGHDLTHMRDLWWSRYGEAKLP